MKKLIPFLIILVFSAGCEKNTVISPTLFGKWEWTSTCGGFAGICYTPQSTGQNSYIIFTADSNFYFYGNDTLKIKGKFHVFNITVNNESYKYLEAGSMGGEYTLTGDELSWPENHACCDCFGTSYIRTESLNELLSD